MGSALAVLREEPSLRDADVLLLPGVAPFGGARRIATAVTLRVGAEDVRVYSVHLGTVVNHRPVWAVGVLGG